MPELPEVETIVNDLKKKIVGRKIAGVWFDFPKMIKIILGADKRGLDAEIRGMKIVDVKRRGKNILIYLTKSYKLWPDRLKVKSYILLIHQKMTGHLLYGKWQVNKVASSKYKVVSLIGGVLEEKVNNYIHFILYLDNGWQVGLSDLRKFAKILFSSKDEIENLAEVKNLGPEPIYQSLKVKKYKSIKALDFISLISYQKRKIKQVLMDQNVIAGIGNIYSDEILWQAKIHPFRKANELRVNELKNLYKAMKEILTKAVKLRGTSISDFRDAFGKSSGYAKIRKVYRREDEPCLRCGSMVKRIKIGGRSAHYCPKCQKI